MFSKKVFITLCFYFAIAVGEWSSPRPLEDIPKDQMNLEPKTIKASDLKSRSRSSSITDTPTSSYRMQRSHSLSRFVFVLIDSVYKTLAELYHFVLKNDIDRSDIE